nr:immunoglobulin light chain junction region [Macaca mulatta]MOX70837.1 immunoglobulin light chain junction region [Macaca mulatta]MOX71503.1 immunoglobulin light chain junction region [Macaca mulatta]MOX72689.1 immunoglobulin light chain junction region [Macaca mulatta]MOX73693.1 immunoglobulin light chain junction region [Macaca mulatta]
DYYCMTWHNNVSVF